MPIPKAASQRWRATTRLKIEKRGEPTIVIQAGDECVGTPENWPPRWLIDQGLVEPIGDDSGGAPAAGEGSA